MRKSLWVAGIVALATALPAIAQDSVANTQCASDAVWVWQDSSYALGSEQCNYFVVDLQPFTTSCGHEFGIAPLLKSGRSNQLFPNNLMSAQGLSRLQGGPGPFFNGSGYMYWNAPGFGVNNDPNFNTPGTLISSAGRIGNQFAVVAADFGTTDAGVNYNGVLGAIVNYSPYNPGRLYVSRIQAAVNGCDPTANLAAFGVGSIDERGDLFFRADANLVTGGCGLTNVVGNNIFRVGLAQRDCDVLNVISNDFPGGQFDAPATGWLVRNSATTHNTPGIVPGSVTGGAPWYIGSNFVPEYVYGPSFGSINTTNTHLAPGVANHRGNVSYTSKNCQALASVRGIAGIIGLDGNGNATYINVWGLSATGSVTGRLGLLLPAVVTDNWDGTVNDPGLNEFDHYHSQVAFNGGNGQIALNVDQDGNLLAAGEVDHPNNGGANWPKNYIAVARVNCATGNVQWTMAGYNRGITGKPIVDCSGGVVGQMVSLDNVTGGVPFGPSVSAPMIDSAGNVWFLSAIEDFNGGDYDTALLRAVYDPVAFSYRLELVFKAGDIFTGQNSTRDYVITFLGIADSNSVSSGTAWSQNISEVPHNDDASQTYAPEDPRTLGGLVINAEILYDVNDDGVFESCDVGGVDVDYQVLLYVGALDKKCGEFLCGDMGCDGTFNNADIPDFVLALTNPAGWQAAHPGCDLVCVGDTNGDGSFNNADIPGFVTALTSGTCPRDQ